MNATTIGVIIAGIVTVIGALTTAVISILTSIRETRTNTQQTKDLTVAAAEVSKARGVVRDNKIQEIHLLVNSRLLTVLRLLVSVSKQLAVLTGKPEDVASYEAAKVELAKAEASANVVATVNNEQSNTELIAAEDADKKIADVIAKVKDSDSTVH